MRTLLLSVMGACAGAAFAQSENSFSSVTNDWHSGAFTNVYLIAQSRLSVNSNDVVAAYIMFDWSVCFASLTDVSNSVSRVIELSDTVTNELFRTKYLQLRPEYTHYRDAFLPTVDEEMRQAERHKSYLSGKDMPSAYMLNLLNEAGMW